MRPARRTVVFESWRGRYADSPRAVSEYLARRRPELRRVWVVADRSVEVPPDVEVVVRNTPAYFYAIARADWFLANDMMPRYPGKSGHTTYVQFWHGTPLKRIGFDVDQPRYAGAEVYGQRLARDIRRWDYLVSPNRFSTEVFRRAFRYHGEVLETGYPRNDVLSGDGAERRKAEVRARLGVPASARVILYAPTWRDDAGQPGAQPNPLAGGLDALVAGLSEDTVLLLRLHHNDTHLGASSSPRVVDVSAHPDIQELYLASDALVTDYSSTMFDYAVTGRPMVFFTYDLERYRSGLRGFYFDLEGSAPGPLVSTPDDLARVLGDLGGLQRRYREPYARFRDAYCHLDDGRAAERVVSTLFDR